MESSEANPYNQTVAKLYTIITAAPGSGTLEDRDQKTMNEIVYQGGSGPFRPTKTMPE